MSYFLNECPECGGLRPGDASGAGDVCTCNVCPSCGYPLPNRAGDSCGYCEIPEVRAELGFNPLKRKRTIIPPDVFWQDR